MNDKPITKEAPSPSRQVAARVESLQRSDTLVKELLVNSGTPREQLATLESLAEVMKFYRSAAMRALRAQAIAEMEAGEIQGQIDGRLRRVPRNEMLEDLAAADDD